MKTEEDRTIFSRSSEIKPSEAQPQTVARRGSWMFARQNPGRAKRLAVASAARTRRSGMQNYYAIGKNAA
jgi:hypothetical protein